MNAAGDGLPGDTPDAVHAYALLHGPRQPVTDPTLGRDVVRNVTGTPPHRLVAIGDSITQGFQSGAIFNTDLSYPAIIAHELGWSGFRRPQYPGRGGLPLNIELVLRELEDRFGHDVDLWEAPLALFRIRDLMDNIEDYWERGPGRLVPTHPDLMHALAIFGWNLGDALTRTAASCAAAIAADPATDALIHQGVQRAAERAALRVYPTNPALATSNMFDIAAMLAADHGAETETGIETLIIMLGSNNALATVCDLRLTWTTNPQSPPTMWAPADFNLDLRRIVDQVQRIGARHVVWGTVPHVTIAPIARGLGDKTAPGSRYFSYYSRPWLTENQFDPGVHPHLTGEQARAIDYGIDMFNEAITTVVDEARSANQDWYLFDLTGLLDSLATRRYIDDPAAQPAWWKPYELPAPLANLNPPPNTHFLTSNGQGGRANGGLFSLDGVHPTTVGYGIIAQELIKIMERAGVEFRTETQKHRTPPVSVEFDRLIRSDTLLTRPPQNLASALDTLGWAESVAGLFHRALPL